MTYGATPKRIVFFRTDQLGDTILNLPVVDQLKNMYPAARITWVCHPSLSELLSAYPGIDEVITFSAGRRRAAFSEWFDLFQKVRTRRFDLCFISNARKDLHLLAWLAGIRKRIGYERKWGWLLTDRIRDQKTGRGLHEIFYNLELLRPLGASFETDAKVDFYLPSDMDDADQCKITSPYLVLHPFTSDPRKQWPLESFGRLAKRLIEVAGLYVVIIGADEDVERVRELDLPTSGQIVDRVGKTSLRSLVALLRRARLLVGPDSGPMHLAAGVKIPVVAIYAQFQGSADPSRWGPWGKQHTIIHKPLEEITMDEVVQATLSKW